MYKLLSIIYEKKQEKSSNKKYHFSSDTLKGNVLEQFDDSSYTPRPTDSIEEMLESITDLEHAQAMKQAIQLPKVAQISVDYDPLFAQVDYLSLIKIKNIV